MQVGTLYVVATPIGNLDDISARALRILRAVELIAAEDTRRTAKLLNHFGVTTRMVSFHAHSNHGRLVSLVDQLRGGQSVAIVSDAGTPGIADPGAELIRLALQAGIPVDSIPGPCAPISAAVVSGFDLSRLTVFGFASARSNSRIRFLKELAAIPGTIVFLESPLRIRDTLTAMEKLLAERPIMVAREMTKIHQEFIYGSAAEVQSQLKQARGEFTVVVGNGVNTKLNNVLQVNEGAVRDDFGRLIENKQAGRREILRAVAKRHGISLNSVYRIVEAGKR